MGNGAVSLEDQIEGFCVAIVDGCAAGRTETIFPCMARALVGVAIEGQSVGCGIIGNLTVAEYVGCIVRGDLCAADPEIVADERLFCDLCVGQRAFTCPEGACDDLIICIVNRKGIADDGFHIECRSIALCDGLTAIDDDCAGRTLRRILTHKNAITAARITAGGFDCAAVDGDVTVVPAVCSNTTALLPRCTADSCQTAGDCDAPGGIYAITANVGSGTGGFYRTAGDGDVVVFNIDAVTVVTSAAGGFYCTAGDGDAVVIGPDTTACMICFTAGGFYCTARDRDSFYGKDTIAVTFDSCVADSNHLTARDLEVIGTEDAAAVTLSCCSAAGGRQAAGAGDLDAAIRCKHTIDVDLFARHGNIGMGDGVFAIELQIQRLCAVITDDCTPQTRIAPCIVTLTAVIVQLEGIGFGIIGGCAAVFVCDGQLLACELRTADPEVIGGGLSVSIGNDQRRSAVILHLGNQRIAFRILGDGDDNLVCACVIGNARDAAVDLGNGVLINARSRKGDLSEVSQRRTFRCRCRGACRHGCIFCHCRQIEGKGLCLAPAVECLGQLKLHLDGIGHFRNLDFRCDIAVCIDDRTLFSIKLTACGGQNTDAFAEGQAAVGKYAVAVGAVFAVHRAAGSRHGAARDVDLSIGIEAVASATSCFAVRNFTACGCHGAARDGDRSLDTDAAAVSAVAAGSLAAGGRHGAAQDGEVSARHKNAVAHALTAGRIVGGDGQAAAAGDRDAAVIDIDAGAGVCCVSMGDAVVIHQHQLQGAAAAVVNGGTINFIALTGIAVVIEGQSVGTGIVCSCAGGAADGRLLACDLLAADPEVVISDRLFCDLNFLCRIAVCIDDISLFSIKLAAHGGYNAVARAHGQHFCIQGIAAAIQSHAAGGIQAAAGDLDTAVCSHAAAVFTAITTGGHDRTAAGNDDIFICPHASAAAVCLTTDAGQAAAGDLDAAIMRIHASAAAILRCAADGRQAAARDRDAAAARIHTVAVATSILRRAAVGRQAADAFRAAVQDLDAAVCINTTAISLIRCAGMDNGTFAIEDKPDGICAAVANGRTEFHKISVSIGLIPCMARSLVGVVIESQSVGTGIVGGCAGGAADGQLHACELLAADPEVVSDGSTAVVGTLAVRIKGMFLGCDHCCAADRAGNCRCAVAVVLTGGVACLLICCIGITGNARAVTTGDCIDGLAGEIGISIFTDGLLKDDLGLVAVQQVGNLARGELGGGLGGGGAFHICSGAAHYCVADAELDGILSIPGTAAQVVAVCDRTFVVPADYAADIVAAGDCADVIAVCDGSAITAGYSTDPITVAGDCTGIIAVRDRAGREIPADYTADKVVSTHNAAGIIAVCDSADNLADYTADIVAAAQIRINDTDILYCANVYKAEQADKPCFAVIKIQTGDGVVCAVKGAGVAAAAAADRCPYAEAAAVQAAVGIKDIFIDGNILHQLAVDGFVTAVDLCRKPVELTCVRDLIVAVAVQHGRLVAATVCAEAVFIENVCTPGCGEDCITDRADQTLCAVVLVFIAAVVTEDRTADRAGAVYYHMVDICICIAVGIFVLTVLDQINRLAVQDGISILADVLAPCAAQLVGNFAGLELFGCDRGNADVCILPGFQR